MPAFPAGLLLLVAPAAAQIPAVHGLVLHEVSAEVVEGQAPVLTLRVAELDAVYAVECTVAGRTQGWTTGIVAHGEPATFTLRAAPPTTQADCLLVARFGNGLSERRSVALSWRWLPPPPPPAPADGEAGAAPAAGG